MANVNIICVKPQEMTCIIPLKTKNGKIYLICKLI